MSRLRSRYDLQGIASGPFLRRGAGACPPAAASRGRTCRCPPRAAPCAAILLLGCALLFCTFVQESLTLMLCNSKPITSGIASDCSLSFSHVCTFTDYGGMAKHESGVGAPGPEEGPARVAHLLRSNPAAGQAFCEYLVGGRSKGTQVSRGGNASFHASLPFSSFAYQPHLQHIGRMKFVDRCSVYLPVFCRFVLVLVSMCAVVFFRWLCDVLPCIQPYLQAPRSATSLL